MEQDLKANLLYQSNLEGAETHYTKLENLVYALFITARKLQPYFQAHIIILLTDQLIKSILHQLDTSRQVTKWIDKLFEFGIKFQPWPSIKAQVLVNFLVEHIIPDKLAKPDEAKPPV